ncbi:MAG: right-handed parallel beta-helix repeat-containing protein [Chloroflexi bacterium]|nr:right-handed parallel beta-helix repeat-containing protein [Chloroflexota bacterium]
MNSIGDAPDENLADGLCQTASGECTLRAAIQQANARAGVDDIWFNLSGPGPYTITIGSPLPAITEALNIDGRTQPGWVSAPIVELRGLPTSGNGLTLTAGGSSVRSLAINRFSSSGIAIGPGGGNIVEGNYIGIGTDGFTTAANGSGIRIDNSAGNQIGGTTPEARNVIGGNFGNGIRIWGAASVGNRVIGNYIGVAADGMTPRGNIDDGIDLMDSTNTEIGGTNPGEGNIIAYSTDIGVVLKPGGTTARIPGNAIFANNNSEIDLGNNGPTPNDGLLIPGTANQGIDTPVFTTVWLSGSNLTVSGYVGSAPGQTAFGGARVEIFLSQGVAGAPGEGQLLLGVATTAADGTFGATFSVSGVSAGNVISGTATGAYTSEFSLNALVTP